MYSIKEAYNLGKQYNSNISSSIEIYNSNLLVSIFNQNNNNIKLNFLLGYCENNTHINVNNNNDYILDMNVYYQQNLIYKYIHENLNISCNLIDNKIQIVNSNIFDFLYILFDNISDLENIKNTKLFKQYSNISNFYNRIDKPDKKMIYQLPICKFMKTIDRAIIPKKRGSDVGYDLTIIKKIKDIGSNTTLYTTGIKVIPDMGYYFEIIGRSSLSKSGYLVTNSVGVIDSNYRGELMISLTKHDNKKPDLELPFRCAQLLIRKFINYHLIEDKNSFETNTSRNEGGFGSTGL